MTFAARLVRLTVSLSFVRLALRSVWLNALHRHVRLLLRRYALALHVSRTLHSLRLRVHVPAPLAMSASAIGS